jgi:hypothetical protein
MVSTDDSKMYITAIIMVAFIFGSIFISMCVQYSSTEKTIEKNFINVPYKITIIELCEYIKISDSGWIHKGNCNNPIHQR